MTLVMITFDEYDDLPERQLKWETAQAARRVDYARRRIRRLRRNGRFYGPFPLGAIEQIQRFDRWEGYS